MTHHWNNSLLHWQQAEGRRHALDGLPVRPNESFRALCGVEVSARREDIVLLGAKCTDPTCWDCDRAWRVRIGMPVSDGKP